MREPLLRSLLLVIGFLCSTALAAPGPSLEQQREWYREARQALTKKDEDRYQGLKAQLEDYPLYPYLIYREHLDARSQLDRETVEAFEQRFADTPLPRLLRRHWLAYLAGKKRWAELIDGYDEEVANTALQCHYRRALFNRGNRAAAFRELETLWVVGRSQHDACDPIFEAWLKSPQFSSNFAWQRFWLALGNNRRSLARYTLRFIDNPKRKAQMEQALALQGTPTQLASFNDQQWKQLPSRTRLLVLKRMSRTDPADLLQLLERRQLITQPAYQAMVEHATKRLLQRYDPNAHRWAAKVDPNHNSVELLEWRIRDALVRNDWPMIGELLEQLPTKYRYNDRWRYWQAITLDQGDSEAQNRAAEIFSELARNRSFYGFLAADRLGLEYSLNNTSTPATAEQLQQLQARPAILRARELFHHNQLIEARREWVYATEESGPDEHYQLAQLARNWGWYPQAIRATIAAKRWDDLVLRFPLAYNQQAAQQARQQRIDSTWVMAIIRQESAFMADARSRVGAMGLMQLMPATAKQTARSQGLRYRNSSQLHDVEFNIQLGSAYLGQMYRRFDQQRALASAAYNAGPHRVKRWLEQRGHLPLDAWIETIPFNETRHYVQSVLSYALIYSDLLGLPKEFLPPHERQPLRPDELAIE